ncbi:hypothetical protein ABPG77_003175 [Micractinium sp. CCAP 211/92]
MAGPAITTFSRRNRRADGADSSDTDSVACGPPCATASSAATTYLTAPSVLTPVAESPAPSVDQDENAGVISKPNPARWRRKNAAERAEAERRAFLSEMRAHFEEVDAFELAVETPPAAKDAPPRSPSQQPQPPGVAAALAAAAPAEPGTAQRQRPMSLGLSRRRSSLAPWAAHAALASSSKANQSPLKLHLPRGAADGRQDALGAAPAAGRRSTLQPASGTHRLSVAADNAGLVAGSPGWAPNRRSLSLHGRRSSVAPSRLSTSGGHNMLSRLSLGLTDALQWLGIKGKIPTAAAGEGQQAAAAPHAGANGAAGVLDRPTLSPIASPGLEEGCESPAEPSPLAGAAAAPADPEQQLKGVQQVATETAATAEPASVVAVEDLPAPSKHQAGGKQPAAVAELDAEIASAAAATAPRDAAAVEQLGQHLAETLELQAAKVEAAAEVEATAASASAEADAAGREAAPEEAASEAETAEPEEELTPLQQLLVLCGQETDPELLPSMDELLGRHVDLKKVRKIGEGTFGEAFKAGGVVLKLVPMEGATLVNGEPQKRADEILAEVSVTLTLSRLNGAAAEPGEALPNVTSGFVETYGVGVCRGRYSEALRREWHRWDKENCSENEEVDIFGDDQLFVVFVVADGGADLEHFQLRSFEEVRSVLLQTALAVGVAEESCQFEHRDLHWGNLLIRRTEGADPGAAVRARLRGVELEAATAGVTVTLIDFTLSRLVTVTGEVAFCDLAADPELFKGPKGSVQAETYRRMKKATKNRWAAHVPATNVFWMQYLVDICLTEKKGWACTREQLNELRAFKRRVLAYPSCAELLFDDFLRAGLLVAQEA